MTPPFPTGLVDGRGVALGVGEGVASGAVSGSMSQLVTTEGLGEGVDVLLVPSKPRARRIAKAIMPINKKVITPLKIAFICPIAYHNGTMIVKSHEIY